jgi:hypothetical protein
MSVYINKTILNADGEEVTVRKLHLSYESGVLTVSNVESKEDGTEEIIPVMVQPWKCHNDGTRSDFIDEQDAYNWFETIKNTLC